MKSIFCGSCGIIIEDIEDGKKEQTYEESECELCGKNFIEGEKENDEND